MSEQGDFLSLPNPLFLETVFGSLSLWFLSKTKKRRTRPLFGKMMEYTGDDVLSMEDIMPVNIFFGNI